LRDKLEDLFCSKAKEMTYFVDGANVYVISLLVLCLDVLHDEAGCPLPEEREMPRLVFVQEEVQIAQNLSAIR